MIQALSKYWWAFALRGALLVIFGLLALFLPVVTLGALVLVFGLYALFEGILLIVAALGRRSAEHWWVLLLQGIVSIAAGIIALSWPGITALALITFIAAWALITGILEIVGAVRLRKEIRGEWSFILSGIVSVLFALIVIMNPAAGALAIVWMIGLYALIFGILLLVLGFKVHKRAHV